MTKKRDSRQAAFNFDDDTDLAVFPPPSPWCPKGVSSSPVWQEVPQALYLSWSEPMQLAYCARRDEDMAQHAEEEDRQFYLDRAQMYKEGIQ